MSLQSINKRESSKKILIYNNYKKIISIILTLNYGNDTILNVAGNAILE